VTARLPVARTSNAIAHRLAIVPRLTAIVGLVGLAGLTAFLIACGPTASGTPSSSEGAAPPVQVVGCLSIDEAECRFVVEQMLAELPEDRGVPFSIQVQLFGCPNDGPCPRSLRARTGMVMVDYADRLEPINATVTGPPESPKFGAQMFEFAGLSEPSSPRVAGFGPFPFDLGHCGLTWQVDFDGSFWVPFGMVDGDASAIINNDSGQMRLLGPNLAEYRNADGFVATLARFPGPKHIWGCM
jgi:hypothetical protein